MESGSIYRADSSAALVGKVHRTTRVVERLRGLIGRNPLTEDEGLLLEPCNSVHTFFMNYPIDVVYLDRALVVLSTRANLNTWRVSGHYRAVLTLELAAGGIERAGIVAGQKLTWTPNNTKD